MSITKFELKEFELTITIQGLQLQNERSQNVYVTSYNHDEESMNNQVNCW